jgi:hypothetical protein
MILCPEPPSARKNVETPGAAFLEESRMKLVSATKPYRKSGGNPFHASNPPRSSALTFVISTGVFDGPTQVHENRLKGTGFTGLRKNSVLG